MDNFDITVGRQFGSGGREIGKLLAKEFGISYYDKELLEEVARKTGLTDDYLAKLDEERQGIWSHAFAGFWYDGMYGGENVFRIQSEVISRLAAEKSCVFVGRGADYILREHPRCVNIFIHAPVEFCAERLVGNDGIPENKVREMIRTINKRRASFYNFYTDRKWGSASSYHLSVDSSVLGTRETAQVIADFIRRRFQFTEKTPNI